MIQSVNIIISVSITTLEEVFLKVGKINDSLHNPSSLNSVNYATESINRIENQNNFARHMMALIKKRINFLKRDKQSLICEIFLPCLIVLVGLALTSTGSTFEPQIEILNMDLYDWQVQQMYTILPSQSTSLPWMNGLQTYYYVNQNNSLLAADEFYFNNDTLYNDGIGWYAIYTPITDTYKYSFFADSRCKDSPPVLLNSLNNNLYRSLTNKSLSITVINDPLVLTSNQKAITRTVSGSAALFIFALGLAFIPASIIAFIVKEKYISMKHQQMVSGVSLSAYWLSNFLLDISKQLIPAAFAIGMIQAFQVDSMTEGTQFGVVCGLFLLYTWSIVPYSYLLSFLFQQEGNAMLVTFFVNLILGSVFPLVMWIMRLIQSTRSVAKILMWILRLFPSFSFGFGILNLTSANIYAQTEGYQPAKEVDDIDIAGGDLLMLGITGIIYFILVFICEYVFNIKHLTDKSPAQSQVQGQSTPSDPQVVQEQQICQTAEPSNFPILVRDIQKIYSTGKLAVDRVSFKVDKGEVFGLLGVNGAGKSTSFKMLSGEIKPTQGEAWIMGHSLTNQLPQARQQIKLRLLSIRFIGYCPQFDALLDKLTVKEHLELYSTIKDIPQTQTQQQVTKIIKQMDLIKYGSYQINLFQFRFENVCAGELSGGNKRKLSVGIAMIGNPPVILLDEPSTGMDPEARRFMWNVISAIATKRREASIILTTHSMEEAEALSTKCSIMVAGQLRCLGSIPQIKLLYGGGYELEIKLSIKQEIVDQFQNLINQEYVEQSSIKDTLNKLNVSHLQGQLKSDGTGQQVWVELERKQRISSLKLIDWVSLQVYGDHAIKTLENILGVQLSIVEHFDAFYKLKVQSRIPLSQFFKILEDKVKMHKKKKELMISHYSIKQTTLEQIFNQFANGEAVLNNNPIRAQMQGIVSPIHNQQINESLQISIQSQEKGINPIMDSQISRSANGFQRLNEDPMIEMPEYQVYEKNEKYKYF